MYKMPTGNIALSLAQSFGNLFLTNTVFNINFYLKFIKDHLFLDAGKSLKLFKSQTLFLVLTLQILQHYFIFTTPRKIEEMLNRCNTILTF